MRELVIGHRSLVIRAKRDRGQVLLLAVLVLILLAILGATFVALVAHNVAQAARMQDVAIAKEAADAGVRYVHQKMLASPEGADWRLPVADTDPATPGVQLPANYYTSEEISRGYGCDAATAASLSPSEFGALYFIKIDNPAEAQDSPLLQNTPGSQLSGRSMVKIEYFPGSEDRNGNGILDPGEDRNGNGVLDPFPTVFDANLGGFRYDEFSPFIKITSVGESANAPGLFRASVAYVPLLLPDRMFNVIDRRGTGAVQPFGAPVAIDLDGDGLSNLPAEAVLFVTSGGLFSNAPINFFGTNVFSGRVMAAGDFSFAGTSVAVNGVNVQTSRFPDTRLPRPTGLGLTDFNPAGGSYLDNMGILEPSADPGGLRAVTRLNGPRLDAKDSSGQVMLARAARESGQWFINNHGTPPDPSDDTVDNIGFYGFGRSIYINNSGDVQSQKVEALINNWRRVDAASEAYWYGPMYTPPGAEVIFYDQDQGYQNYQIQKDPADPSKGLLNEPAIPDIHIVLHADAFGRIPTFVVPTSDGEPFTDSNGNGAYDVGEAFTDTNGNGRYDAGPINLVNPTQLAYLDVAPNDGVPDSSIILDYPEDGVLYFTGNVRVRGRLPRADTANGRSYDVTLVSRGNIYIDGNILRPRDRDGSIPDIESSRLALLAEGSVVVNGTRTVLRGIDTNADFIPDTREFRTRGHWRLNVGQHFATFFGFGGTAAEDQGLNPADIYLKLRVRGSPLSPFIVRINAVAYDFDRRDPATYPEAAGVNPCTQISGEVETLYIPLVKNGAAVDFDNDPATPPGRLDLDGGGLNVVQIYPAPTATDPLELFAVGLDRRVNSDSPLLVRNPIYDDLGPAPLVASGTATLRPALDEVVSAMCYAEKGTWFVIPGDYWDRGAVARDVNGDGLINATIASTDVNGNGYLDPEDAWADINGDGVLDPPDVDANGNGVADWAENRRQNVRITVNGSISESVAADIYSVTDWMDKFSYFTGTAVGFASPAGAGVSFGQVVYNYDPGLRSNRLFGAYANLPRVPRLPVSDSVVYFGTIL